MKIVKAKEMARIEQLAYASGASEESFMNQAGVGLAKLTVSLIDPLQKAHVTLLCGSGNNAGDAYVAGRLLHEAGYSVEALALAPFEKSSPLCQKQSQRFINVGGKIHYISASEDISFAESSLILDGILGTGFHGKIQDLFKAAIEKANASKLPIIAIDIPSGINGTTGEIAEAAIQAADTLFLGLPKVGCFSKEAWNYVGRVHVYDFGLGATFIDLAEEDYVLIDDLMIKEFLPKIQKNRHKYQAGYVVGIGGSSGMPGAPLLSSFAVLRAGAGIVRLLHPEGMESELGSLPLEVIRQGYAEGNANAILESVKRASAIFIGPGMGTSASALSILQKVLPELDKPCVIDAEALSLLAEHEIKFPSKTIMTPHHGEMKRLLHINEEISFLDLLEKSKAFANQKNITLVLKGAPTFILHPNCKPYVTSRGDPGMATAGSGDVLTGIIAAFLAQTQDPLKAAILGVQLHAIAGEYAAQKWTSYCMVASDITEALPQAIKDYLRS